MGIPENRVLGMQVSNGRRGMAHLKERPAWATPDKMLKAAHVKQLETTEVKTWPRLEVQGQSYATTVVLRGDYDIVYQFQLKPKYRKGDFGTLLDIVIEQHFGSTDNFFLDYVHELDSWALLAREARANPFYNETHYIEDFLSLLDAALLEEQQA